MGTTYDPFATAVNYRPTEDDVSLEYAINCALKYIEDRDEKNQRFLEGIVNKSLLGHEIRNKLLYILSNTRLVCREYEDCYILEIKSTVTELKIHIVFELNKNNRRPVISCTSELNELESTISNMFINICQPEDFIDICKMNLVYSGNRYYVIKVNELLIELTLDEEKISLDSIKGDYINRREIMVVYPESKIINTGTPSVTEDGRTAIIYNLDFFIKSCYVNKNNIPKEILKCGPNSKVTIKQIIDSNDIANDNEKVTTYYIELPTGVKELRGIDKITDAKDEMYLKCRFTDGSFLEFSKDKLFKITKATERITMAEKVLGLK